MAAPVTIKYGAFEPDRDTHDSAALTEATNVIPIRGGAYGPFRGHEPVTGLTMASEVLGARIVLDENASPIIYAGTVSGVSTRLYEEFTSIYTAGSTLSIEEQWWFQPFASKIIAGHPQVAPLKGDIGSTSALAACSGTPPKARCAAAISNFLWLGNVDDGADGICPNRVRWSGFNNPDTWGSSSSTQADYQDMPDQGGPVVALAGREVGSIFQRRMISRALYVGLPGIFDIETVEANRGAMVTGGVIDIGGIVPFLADDGFYIWNGTNAVPIGEGVNSYFLNRLNHGHAFRITGGYDPINRVVAWAYPADSSISCSRLMLFHLTEGRWTEAEIDLEWLGTGADLSQSIDEIPDIDALGDTSLDSVALLGGRARFVAFDDSHRYGPLSGTPLAGTLATGDYEVADGRRGFVESVRPLDDASAGTVAIGTRAQSLADTLTWSTGTARGVDGACPARSEARYLRFKRSLPAAEWTKASGVQALLQGAGKR